MLSAAIPAAEDSGSSAQTRTQSGDAERSTLPRSEPPEGSALPDLSRGVRSGWGADLLCGRARLLQGLLSRAVHAVSLREPALPVTRKARSAWCCPSVPPSYSRTTAGRAQPG